MKYVLTPIGSAGDVFPFLGLALRLRERGHQVSMITNAHFQPIIESHGIPFEAYGSAEDYRSAIDNPDLFHPIKGFKTVVGYISNQRLMLDLMRKHAGTDGVIIAHTLSLAARLLQEKGEYRVISIVLAPAILRSVYQGPVMRGDTGLTLLPRPMQRAIWWMVDRMIVDPAVAKILDDLRREMGLPKVRHFFDQWLHSPLRTIGTFPEWFGPIQPDWPKSVRLSSFPLFDDVSGNAPDTELLKLVERERPFVFTPGSGNIFGHAFFRAAADACQALGRSALFLTNHPEQLPAKLPAGVHYRDFVPLSRILPLCSGVAHHGGIGTTAAAIAAGVPQIIMPLSHDQPDNAARVVRLHLGGRLHPKEFTAKRLAQLMMHLQSDPQTRANCSARAKELSQTDGLAQSCQLIAAAT